MPVATADINATERFELKSCPEGYVVLRALTYGQILTRRGMAGNLKLSGEKNSDFAGEMALSNENVTLYEFQNCIVEHNLTDASDRQLDLTKASDIKKLGPKVGQEIDELISKINNFEDDDDSD